MWAPELILKTGSAALALITPHLEEKKMIGSYGCVFCWQPLENRWLVSRRGDLLAQPRQKSTSCFLTYHLKHLTPDLEWFGQAACVEPLCHLRLMGMLTIKHYVGTAITKKVCLHLTYFVFVMTSEQTDHTARSQWMFVTLHKYNFTKWTRKEDFGCVFVSLQWSRPGSFPTYLTSPLLRAAP